MKRNGINQGESNMNARQELISVLAIAALMIVMLIAALQSLQGKNFMCAAYQQPYKDVCLHASEYSNTEIKDIFYNHE